MPHQDQEAQRTHVDALRPEDRAIFDVVEKAQEQYRTYLATSEIGNLAKLIVPKPNEQPPRTGLPLTLTVC